jgi:hypothetical protein
MITISENKLLNFIEHLFNTGSFTKTSARNKKQAIKAVLDKIKNKSAIKINFDFEIKDLESDFIRRSQVKGLSRKTIETYLSRFRSVWKLYQTHVPLPNHYIAKYAGKNNLCRFTFYATDHAKGILQLPWKLNEKEAKNIISIMTDYTNSLVQK